MLSWILRLLLILFIIRALVRLVAGFIQGLQAPTPGQGQSTSTGLVRDPVCGTFVVPGRALAVGSGSDAQYFCSERCREAYRSGRREPELAGRR